MAFSQNLIWPPMVLRVGLPGSSALQHDGLDVPVMLQCRTAQETNPKGHWGPNGFFIKSLFLLPPCTQSWYTQSHDLQARRCGAKCVHDALIPRIFVK